MLFKNNKNGKIYEVIGECLNCTNAQDGQEMFIYRLCDHNLIFVRSKEEFYKKFTNLKSS